MTDVIENVTRSRFELVEDGLTAFADYSRMGDQLIIRHVESPPALRGTGAAGRLMEGVLAFARREGFKITPICGYADAYIRRHKEHQDLLA